MHFSEAVGGRARIAIHQAPCGQQLQRAAGDDLHETIVEIAGQTQVAPQRPVQPRDRSRTTPYRTCLRPDRRTPPVSPVARLLRRLPGLPPAGPPSCGDNKICMPLRRVAQGTSGNHFGAFFVVHMMSTSCAPLSPVVTGSSTGCPPTRPQESGVNGGADWARDSRVESVGAAERG